VLIADPDDAFRSRLARILTDAGYAVLQADTGDGALAMARSHGPAAVVLEVPLAGLSGYEVCHLVRAELGTNLPVLFLSSVRTEPYDRVAGLLLGADDYMVKPFAAGELLARLANLIRRSRSRSAGLARDLTRRELEVLDLMGEGLRQEGIARRLFISPKTVATHVEHILRKLGVHSSAEAIVAAYREDIIRPAALAAARTEAPTRR
jgi:DNA-binding NarL/FixJ family response regulator